MLFDRIKIQKIMLKYADQHASNIKTSSFNEYLDVFEQKFQRSYQDQKLSFMLPGFPYKSANTRDKVLGRLPDLGEKYGLTRLNFLLEDLSKALQTKCRLIICSDGFAFNDIKNIPDQHVLDYRTKLKETLEAYPNISVRSLDDFIPRGSISDMRTTLETYGKSLEYLQNQLQRSSSIKILHSSLTAFAKRDLLRNQNESKRLFLVRCKEVAMKVLQRSNAWANLIKEHMPNAIRLTIHPYQNVKDKFPICLVPALDGRWRTPWHNVPIVTSTGAILLTPKKSIVSESYISIYREERPWAYVAKSNGKQDIEHSMSRLNL